MTSLLALYSDLIDWLRGIGLPQYQRMFLDGRIDGRMLNFISMVAVHVLHAVVHKL